MRHGLLLGISRALEREDRSRALEGDNFANVFSCMTGCEDFSAMVAGEMVQSIMNLISLITNRDFTSP
jgi:hypothetical protein